VEVHPSARRAPLAVMAAAAALVVGVGVVALRASRPELAHQVEHHVSWGRFAEARALVDQALRREAAYPMLVLWHQLYAEEWSRGAPEGRAELIRRIRADGRLIPATLEYEGTQRIDALGELAGGDFLLVEAARRGRTADELPEGDELDLGEGNSGAPPAPGGGGTKVLSPEEAKALAADLEALRKRHPDELARHYFAGNLLVRRRLFEEARREWRALGALTGGSGMAREKERRMEARPRR
jgi:hypothetical protein